MFQTQGKGGEVLLTEHRLYTKDIQLHRIGVSQGTGGLRQLGQLGFIRAISSGQIDALWHLGFKGTLNKLKDGLDWYLNSIKAGILWQLLRDRDYNYRELWAPSRRTWSLVARGPVRQLAYTNKKEIKPIFMNESTSLLNPLQRSLLKSMTINKEIQNQTFCRD